jgi:hypothetical protein
MTTEFFSMYFNNCTADHGVVLSLRSALVLDHSPAFMIPAPAVSVGEFFAVISDLRHLISEVPARVARCVRRVFAHVRREHARKVHRFNMVCVRRL